MEKEAKGFLRRYITSFEIKIFLGVGLIIFVLPLIVTRNWGFISFKNTGEIGDTIGGITAPFLAFFGSILVYLALKAQIKANKLVQKQFKQQQKIEFRQNFETTFFNLLSIHHQIIADIDYETHALLENEDDLNMYLTNNLVYKVIYNDLDKKTNLTSRDVFKTSVRLMSALIEDDLMFEEKIPLLYYDENNVKQFKDRFNEIEDFDKGKISFNGLIMENKLESIYNWMYLKLSTDFGHYFRNLYRIIKMIDEQRFTKDPIENFVIQYSYTSIIRSQLSNAEIKWIFFNCISSFGCDKFKPYLEKYTLLKVVNITDPVYGYYAPLYANSAFEKPQDSMTTEHLEKYQKIALST